MRRTGSPGDMKTYTNPIYPYRRSPDQDAGPARHAVVVVGAGPIGLAAAIDLAQRGVPVVVLDEDETVSVGSRAICYAKRALEILDRLGVRPARRATRAIGWNVGRVFFRDALAYRFDLLPEAGPPPAGVREPAAVLARGVPRRPRPRAARDRPAVEEQGRRA